MGAFQLSLSWASELLSSFEILSEIKCVLFSLLQSVERDAAYLMYVEKWPMIQKQIY